jgi:hypothetical protein
MRMMPRRGSTEAACQRTAVNGPQTRKELLPSSLTDRFQGRDFRLTDVHGEVVKKMLA